VPLKVRDVIKRWNGQAGVTCELQEIVACSEVLMDVSGKLGDDVRPGSYRAILRQTGIKDEP
jgi:hypothetical protein